MDRVKITFSILGEDNPAHVFKSTGITTQKINGEYIMYAYTDCIVKLDMIIKLGYYIKSFSIREVGSADSTKISRGYNKPPYNGITDYFESYSFKVLENDMIVDIRTEKLPIGKHKISLSIPGGNEDIWEVIDHPDKMVLNGEQVTIRVKLDGMKFSLIELHEARSRNSLNLSSNIHRKDYETDYVDILFIMPCDDVNGMISIYKEEDAMDGKKRIYVMPDKELSVEVVWITGFDVDRFDDIYGVPRLLACFHVRSKKEDLYTIGIVNKNNGQNIEFTSENITENETMAVDSFKFIMPDDEVIISIKKKKDDKTDNHMYAIKKRITGKGNVLIDYGHNFIPLNDEAEYGTPIRLSSVPESGYSIDSLGIKVTTVDNRVIHIDNNIIDRDKYVELSTEFIMPPSDVIIDAEFKPVSPAEELAEQSRRNMYNAMKNAAKEVIENNNIEFEKSSDSDIIDWFEIPDDLARELSDDLVKMTIRQTMLADLVLDETKYMAAEKLLVPIMQSVEAKKVLITRQYVPEKYRSEAYQWNYDGYEIDGNRVQILKAGIPLLSKLSN